MKRLFIFGLVCVFSGLILGFAAGRMWMERYSDSAEIMPGDDENGGKAISVTEGRPVVELSSEQISEFGIEIGQAGPAKLVVRKILPGEIVLDPDRVANVTPRVSGVVVRIDKTLGDRVHKGEVMVVIDSHELADAKAGYLAAAERCSLAQVSFDREKKLWDKKISSEEDYLDARQALAEANIVLRNARQKLYSLGFAQDYPATLPDLPDSSYTRYEVLAPFDGTVIEKQIGMGEVVTDVSQIYRIADLGTVWAELTVRQEDLGVISTGQTVSIGAGEFDDMKTAGRIEYISPVIDEATRTAVARVVICNSECVWRPGTFVTGQVDVGAVEVPVAVARSAVQKLADRDVVFVRTDKGFEPQAVQIGRTDTISAEILDGLESGRRYVRANAFTLKAELSKGTFAGGDD